MKSKIFLILAGLTCLLSLRTVKSQDTGKFPLDPYVILKTWNFNTLVKNMGEGEQIIGKMKNQEYVAGMKYPYDMLGMHGILVFTFNKDSIALIQFRKEHPVRKIDPALADRMVTDTLVRKNYNLSVQAEDSLRRDSLVKVITGIQGPSISSGRTAVTEKNARYSAIWINKGYSCLYKDYLYYCEIVFSLVTVPLWAIGEFDIPAGTEIIQKVLVNTRKMGWSANLLGYPSSAPKMTYSDFFLMLEFSTGQKYIEKIPKNPGDYIQRMVWLNFAGGQRTSISLPWNSVGYLPQIIFEDCDGDAIPEAWIRIPADQSGRQKRHCIYSLPFKEPNLVFNSDDILPASISMISGQRLLITLQDGTTRNLDLSAKGPVPSRLPVLFPKAFTYLNSTNRNNDGSTDFIGGIDLRFLPSAFSAGTLEITCKHGQGGWEASQFKIQ